ncbi:hypothetical protein IE077_000724, partial [Cardiosporidium cionae]
GFHIGQRVKLLLTLFFDESISIACKCRIGAILFRSCSKESLQKRYKTYSDLPRIWLHFLYMNALQERKIPQEFGKFYKTEKSGLARSLWRQYSTSSQPDCRLLQLICYMCIDFSIRDTSFIAEVLLACFQANLQSFLRDFLFSLHQQLLQELPLDSEFLKVLEELLRIPISDLCDTFLTILKSRRKSSFLGEMATELWGNPLASPELIEDSPLPALPESVVWLYSVPSFISQNNAHSFFDLDELFRLHMMAIYALHELYTLTLEERSPEVYSLVGWMLSTLQQLCRKEKASFLTGFSIASPVETSSVYTRAYGDVRGSAALTTTADSGYKIPGNFALEPGFPSQRFKERSSVRGGIPTGRLYSTSGGSQPSHATAVSSITSRSSVSFSTVNERLDTPKKGDTGISPPPFTGSGRAGVYTPATPYAPSHLSTENLVGNRRWDDSLVPDASMRGVPTANGGSTSTLSTTHWKSWLPQHSPSSDPSGTHPDIPPHTPSLEALEHLKNRVVLRLSLTAIKILKSLANSDEQNAIILRELLMEKYMHLIPFFVPFCDDSVCETLFDKIIPNNLLGVLYKLVATSAVNDEVDWSLNRSIQRLHNYVIRTMQIKPCIESVLLQNDDIMLRLLIRLLNRYMEAYGFAHKREAIVNFIAGRLKSEASILLGLSSGARHAYEHIKSSFRALKKQENVSTIFPFFLEMLACESSD